PVGCPFCAASRLMHRNTRFYSIPSSAVAGPPGGQQRRKCPRARAPRMQRVGAARKRLCWCADAETGAPAAASDGDGRNEPGVIERLHGVTGTTLRDAHLTVMVIFFETTGGLKG